MSKPADSAARGLLQARGIRPKRVTQRRPPRQEARHGAGFVVLVLLKEMSSMKLLFSVLAFLILGLGFLGEAEGVPPAKRSATRRTEGRVIRLKGQQLLPRQKMRSLRNGVRQVRTVHGHKLYARLKNGKVASMFAKAPTGKTINAQHLVEGEGGDQVVFEITIDVNGTKITIKITFPAGSVVDGGTEGAVD
jgi:hypothetical protein